MSDRLRNIKFIPYQLESKAEDVLHEAELKGVYKKGEPIDIMLICEKLFNLKISYERLDEMQKGVLGCLDFEQNAIFLDEGIADSNGRNFTVAHELGHFILHKSLYDAVGNDFLLLHDELEPMYEKSRKNIETQANMFASAILMPRDVLIAKWHELDYTSFHEKAQYLHDFFGVSRETAEYRISNVLYKQKP